MVHDLPPLGPDDDPTASGLISATGGASRPFSVWSNRTLTVGAFVACSAPMAALLVYVADVPVKSDGFAAAVASASAAVVVLLLVLAQLASRELVADPKLAGAGRRRLGVAMGVGGLILGALFLLPLVLR